MHVCTHILNIQRSIVITHSPHQCFSTAELQHISVLQKCQNSAQSVEITEVQPVA